MREFSQLVRIMGKLRGKNGCAWDKKQTHKTLIKYLFEEAEEIEAAVKKNDYKNLKEELGDLLLQIIFHSQIAKETGKFTIKDVVDSIIKKLKYRHPHVFKGKKVNSVKEIIKNWHYLKRQEKLTE